MRATFIFQNPRASLLRGVASGTEPDSALLGANHLAEHGIEARVHDAMLTRRALRKPLDRLAWNLREVTLPFELGRTDVLFTPLANLIPLTAAVRRLPVVVVNYGLNLIWRRGTNGRRELLGRSLRHAALVVCLGESQREELIALAGLDPQRTTTLLLPVDDRFFAPAEHRDDATSVVAVGKDLARDYATLALAAERIDAPVELAVYPRNLEGIRLPPNAHARVRSSRELRDLYASAGCVVLPQRPDDYPFGSEGGGLTALLEAMAMGKPVVATERAILSDYLEDGVDGLLVPPGDPAALREAIERVLSDPALAQALGAAGRARVQRSHATRGFAEQLSPLLRLAAESGRRRRESE
jgi:glycosyltransferase involved in cell wall biosynthesis